MNRIAAGLSLYLVANACLVATGCTLDEELAVQDEVLAVNTNFELMHCDDIFKLTGQMWKIQFHQAKITKVRDPIVPGTAIILEGAGFKRLGEIQGAAQYELEFISASGRRSRTTSFAVDPNHPDSEMRAVVPADIEAGAGELRFVFDTLLSVSNCPMAVAFPATQTRVFWNSFSYYNSFNVSAKPSAFVRFDAVPQSDSEIRLEWDDVGGEDEYEVFGGLRGGAITSLGLLNADMTTALVGQLDPATYYDFYIEARNGHGTTRSMTIDERTFAKGVTPPPPNPDGFATVEVLEDSGVQNGSPSPLAVAPPASALEVEILVDWGADGIVDDPNYANANAAGMYPLFMGSLNVPEHGKGFASNAGRRANLSISLTIPPTPGASTDPQFVSFHAEVGFDALGNCTSVTPIAAVGGDFAAGTGNRLMIGAPLAGSLWANLSDCHVPVIDSNGTLIHGEISGELELAMTLSEIVGSQVVLHNSLVTLELGSIPVSPDRL